MFYVNNTVSVLFLKPKSGYTKPRSGKYKLFTNPSVFIHHDPQLLFQVIADQGGVQAGATKRGHGGPGEGRPWSTH